MLKILSLQKYSNNYTKEYIKPSWQKNLHRLSKFCA